MIVAVQGAELVVVRQRRPGAPAPVAELPAGKIEPGESTRDAASRELGEECALRAESLRELGGFWAVPAYSTEFVHVWEASGFVDAPGGEEGIEIERHPVAAALDVLDDAVSLAAFALWRLRG